MVLSWIEIWWINLRYVCWDTSYKMQPLDKTFFGPIKTAYNRACDNWMLANPAKRITTYEVASIFSGAYGKCATIEKGVNGFSSTGIYPFNPNIFSEASSLMTENLDPTKQPEMPRETVATLSEETVISELGPSHLNRGISQKPPRTVTSPPVELVVSKPGPSHLKRGISQKPPRIVTCPIVESLTIKKLGPEESAPCWQDSWIQATVWPNSALSCQSCKRNFVKTTTWMNLSL